MKQHNWAFAAWEIARIENKVKKNATLFHIDTHLDDCIDGIYVKGLYDIKTKEDAIKIATPKDWSKDSQSNSEKKMWIDNFIWPAFAKGTIKNTIFVCDEPGSNNPYDYDSWDDYQKNTIKKHLLTNTLEEFSGKRFWSINELKTHISSNLLNEFVHDKSLILDLDLDYFVDYDPSIDVYDIDEYYQVRKDTEITSDLEYIRDLYTWDCITVALSPNYCGGLKKCEHIFNLFLQVFKLDLTEAKYW